jgi:phosphoglycolate phosphatase-like HAD superfamily hydrolase
MIEDVEQQAGGNGGLAKYEADGLRVLLFDIDGTLIRTVRRPEYRSRVRQVLIDIFGSCGRISEVDFAGKTDLAIYREALECVGISPAEIKGRLPALEAEMVNILYELASTGEVFQVCKGVSQLLEHLATETRLLPSLLTGNVERLARAKLRVAGIGHYFRGPGAYGSDAEERDHLPAIAAARINRHLGRSLPPDRFIIIGDTPRDIACARHFGARVIAIASGSYRVEELTRFSPDSVLTDLSDTKQVIELFYNL